MMNRSIDHPREKRKRYRKSASLSENDECVANEYISFAGAATGGTSWRRPVRLQSLGKLFGEGTVRAIIGPLGSALLMTPGRTLIGTRSLPGRRRRALVGRRRSLRMAVALRRTHRPALLPLRLGRLRRVGAKQPVLQGSAVKTADDGVHLLRVRRVNEREALRLLRFRIANHFNCVRNQVLGAKPALDIVRGHPSRQIAKKDGKTHSIDLFNSMFGPDCRLGHVEGFASKESIGSNLMLPHSPECVNGERLLRTRLERVNKAGEKGERGGP